MTKQPQFHMKGNAWRAMREFIDAKVPGGTAAVAAALTTSHERGVFAESFIPSGWYDALPAEAVTRAAAGLAGLSHAELCRRFGETVLKRDMNGIYRAVLKFASPDLMVKSLPLASRRYFDFVTMRIEHVGARHFVMHASGIPRPVLSTYVNVTEVFTRHAITGSGGRDVHVETSPPRATQTVGDVQTVTLERHMTWSA